MAVEGFHTVVYKAIADFRELYVEVAKARAALAALKDETGRVRVGHPAGTDALAASTDKAAGATNRLADAEDRYRRAAAEAERIGRRFRHSRAALSAAEAANVAQSSPATAAALEAARL